MRRAAAAILPACLLVASQAWASSALREVLPARVEAARRAAPALGVHVVEVASGESVYEYAADRPRILASNAKLFTTAAGLGLLGPQYLFETRLLLRGRLRGERLAGDLAVLGGGDPNISGRHHFGDPYAIFRSWATVLKSRGVRRVAGDLYLVDGLFEGPVVHPDWPRDQLTRWYEAPVAALSFSDNCVLVRVWPASRAGEPAVVETVPRLPIFSLRNRARTIQSSRGHWVAVTRPSNRLELLVSGRVYRRAAPVETWITVTDPVEFFGVALRATLEEEGIEVEGQLRPVGELPGVFWQEVAVHRSDLLTTLEVINKRSQNFYAESLLKLLGSRLCGEGSWSAGLEAVREFLDAIGLDARGLRLADGSGMSRNNRATPRQVTSLLRHMFFHQWGREFIGTLAYSGEPELSWEDRLAEPPYAGNVFAKTGTLRGVSTLSGYAKAGSGRIYAFCILCNESPVLWRAKGAQDGIVRALIDHG